MFYTYILRSKKDMGMYIGYSSDLRKKLLQHKAGKCISTKHRLPVELIHYEAFISKKDAKAREIFLKSGHGREQLKKILQNTL